MAQPILLTGIHRSGTTWAGRMIEQAPGIRYLYEPLNNEHDPSLFGRTMPTSYTYICQENENNFEYHIHRTLKGSLKTQLKGLIKPTRPLWKDPHAFFSAPWMVARFDMQPLILIRHPAAFVLSIIDKKWSFDFNNLRNQPLLMQHLADDAERIEQACQNPGDLVDQGCLLWSIIYRQVAHYQSQFPDWLYVRHEDLALNPIQEFEAIFHRLNLLFTENVKVSLQQSTKSGQPISDQERHPGLRRDSVALITKWKKLLSKDEIFRIRKQTEGASESFYSKKDW